MFISNQSSCRHPGIATFALNGLVLMLMVFAGAFGAGAWAREPGVTDSTIRVGSTLALEGDIRSIGQGMKSGMEAALKGERTHGRTVTLEAVNDFYDPKETAKAAKQLIDKGILLMLGSVGTPTTLAVLPVLAENKVPAVGFFWSGLPGPGEILNFRAGFAQEVASVVEAVLAAGVKPKEICAYAQNDSYGMAGLRGVVTALAKQPGMSDVVAKLNQVIALPEPNPNRNDIGPVGVYQRDTLAVKEGYDSLKQWEKKANTKCRFVATVGTHLPIAQFIGYSRYKGDKWLFGVTSSAGGKNLIAALKEFHMSDGIIATQVVPALDSSLPIVADARKALGDDLDSIQLEGYLVGKMFLAITNNIKGDVTRENFLKAARSQVYDLGGMKVDFTNDNQGSDFVRLTYLEGNEFRPVTPEQLQPIFQ